MITRVWSQSLTDSFSIIQLVACRLWLGNNHDSNLDTCGDIMTNMKVDIFILLLSTSLIYSCNVGSNSHNKGDKNIFIKPILQQ